jgi:DNA primase small subunit
MEFHRATPDERRRYYQEEWSERDLPSFIIESLEMREFGFDHDGFGPKDRYNRFNGVDELGIFLRERAPFSAYNSVSYYDEPDKRKGWKKAELVFDIDAKEMTIKTCCPIGQVCNDCLERAKEVALEITRLLEGNLGVKDIFHVYSGRGYHIRAFDEDIMAQGSEVRAEIFDFVRDSLYTSPDSMMNPPVFISPLTKKTLAGLIESGADYLRTLPGIGLKKAEKLTAHKDEIIDDIKSDRITGLKEVLGEKSAQKFLEHIYKAHVTVLDAKVTVDIKRILRLPSSLHSTVSMKCMEIKDLRAFAPLRDAVPKFVRERRE